MKAINSPPKPLPSTKDLAQIFKEYISTKPKSEESFILDCQALELNGKTFYIAYNKQDKSAVGYINIFLRTIASANEEQKSKQIQRLLEDRRFAVAQFNENLKLTKLSYHTEVLYVINSGEFDEEHNIVNGYISKKCEEQSLKINYIIQNKHRLQQTASSTIDSIIFAGKHKCVKKTEKFHLTDGAIRIQNDKSNTNIVVKDGEMISLECYQSEKNGSSYYIDFKKKEFLLKIYKDGKFTDIKFDFSKLEEVRKKIYDPKEPQSFCLDAEDIKKINDFIEQIKPNIDEQIKQLEIHVDRGATQYKSDERKIDSLVAYINGREQKKNTIGSRPAAQPNKDKPKVCSVAPGDAEQDTQRDPDSYILQLWQLQQKTNEPQKEPSSPPSRTFKPKFTLLKNIVPELNLLEDALLIDTPATESSAPAPATESSAPAPATESSASAPAPTTESSASAPAPATESLVKDSATPSSTPSLPKASDFYKQWEGYFLTEVLQAIANILNEDKPGFVISDDKKNESYELLHSLMTTMSVDDLCEGLALSEEKQEILLQKLLTKSKANYSDEMARFTAKEAMNKTYAEWDC